MKTPNRYEEEVPVFMGDDFFQPNENMYIQLSTEYDDFVGVLHKHEFIEIVYVISGRATHILDHEAYDVEKGDIIVINSNTQHAFYENKEYKEKFISYDLMFTPNFLNDSSVSGQDFSLLSSSFLFYSLFPEEQELISNLNLLKGCDFEFGNIFQKIYHEYKNAEMGYMNIIRVYVAELIIKLFRKIFNSPHTRISEKQQQIVDTIMNYIKDNYSLQIKIDDLAGKLFFNKNYIGKIFKQATGVSISGFVQKIRLDEVCSLLSSTEQTISEIAASCGYNDMKCFYASFKKHTGLTPNEYRKNNISTMKTWDLELKTAKK